MKDFNRSVRRDRKLSINDLGPVCDSIFNESSDVTFTQKVNDEKYFVNGNIWNDDKFPLRKKLQLTKMNCVFLQKNIHTQRNKKVYFQRKLWSLVNMFSRKIMKEFPFMSSPRCQLLTCQKVKCKNESYCWCRLRICKIHSRMARLGGRKNG